MMCEVFKRINSTDYNIGSEEHNNNIIGPYALEEQLKAAFPQKLLQNRLTTFRIQCLKIILKYYLLLRK